MNHIKSHIELDNDEIVEYVRSILLELDDLDNIINEIIFFNRNGNSVYFVSNNIGTYEDGKSGPGNNKDLPIDRVDLLLNIKNYSDRFDYSDVSDVVTHINSYLWERGFGQDPRSSQYKSIDMSKLPIHNCLLIDFDGVRNLERLCVSFRKK
jgi:hypothetical protein